jgi:hypothetical protein
MAINVQKVLLGLLIIAVVSILAYFAKNHSPNRDDRELYEVRQAYSRIPIPAGFEEKGSSFQSKAELALVSKYFKSRTSYDDVKAFYAARLSSDGWTLASERRMTDWFKDLGGRELEFKKNEYLVIIEYAGEKATDEWDYAITVEWKRSP